MTEPTGPKPGRVAGHMLLAQGKPWSHDGKWRETGWTGRGKCQCGALSPSCRYIATRKRWHAKHRQEMLDPGGLSPRDAAIRDARERHRAAEWRLGVDHEGALKRIADEMDQAHVRLNRELADELARIDRDHPEEPS